MRVDGQGPLCLGHPVLHYRIGQRLIDYVSQAWLYHASSTQDSGKYVFKWALPQFASEAERDANRSLSGCPFASVGFDFVQLDSYPGFFQPFYVGGDLLEYVLCFGFAETLIPEPHIARIASCVLTALAFMHARGWAHRDVKLENIFLDDAAPCPYAYLGDFGLARSRDVRGGEFFTRPCGSLCYKAPELLASRPYDESVDMWALGVVMFNLACNCSPFGPSDGAGLADLVRAGKYNRQLLVDKERSLALCDLIDRLLKVNPAHRLSAEEALAHPFFCEQGILDDVVSDVKETLAMVDESQAGADEWGEPQLL
jgi:serine/threonine protein kinase